MISEIDQCIETRKTMCIVHKELYMVVNGMKFLESITLTTPKCEYETDEDYLSDADTETED